MDERTARRATVHDVAREAGVSLATVDRVLNARPGVRKVTAEKVEQAIRTLDFRRDLSASLLARSRDLRIAFLIPDGHNEFMVNLEAAVARSARQARAERITIDTHHIKPLDPRDLAAALDALQPLSCDCAVIVATDHELVRRSIDSATRRGIVVVTLVSDLPGSARKHFIGIDNAAAGRTAASLLGRFCPPGKIGLIAGSLELRDHRERLDGFITLMRDEFPDHTLIGPVEGLEDSAATERQATAMLRGHPDLVGLYNVGAGNGGLLKALQKSGRAGFIRVVVHELSAPTRDGLVSGEIDVVLDQNPDGEIRASLAAARALSLGEAAEVLPEPIEIGIFLRDNLRSEEHHR